MNSTQAQSLSNSLIALNCEVRVLFDATASTWVVQATKPHAKVNSTTMTALAQGVGGPAIIARTDRAEFL